MLGLSFPLRLALSALLNALLAYLLDAHFPQYVTIFGGVGAYVIIGSLLTLMNFIVRPILNLVTFPLHLFMSLVADILVNAIFLWLTYQIVLKMDPNIAALTLSGGMGGWFTISTILGIANWIMKLIL